ncbi:MAG TPA: fumarylacetoacetate hydrolase family protein [Candidatus Margulisiibacteriota bacterium]|nr:fumarylacetoacetate hydrolase family protein [Candidatus Margulisiibacteriota bacterium]
MRLANLKGRATLITPGGAVDVEQGSHGRFGSDPQAIFAQWAAVRAWAAGVGHSGVPFVENDLACPVPRPAQVFGIGLNYRSHAAEAGLPVPERPAVFTKFSTCLTGPFADVVLPSACVDWEVELVVVMGIEAYRVEARDAWRHIAGLTVGQDLSERVVQWSGGGQFSLGKSFPGFGPMGPSLITPDELADPDDLEIGCRVNGEVMQQSGTADMVFSVPQLVAELSAILPLLPGDVIFTGTPAGVGGTRQPPRFLQPGDVLTSHIEGIGTLRNRCVAAA